MRLHSNAWIQLFRPPLRILQVIAKMTVDNAQTGNISWTRWENASCNKSGGKKIWHLADGLVRRDYERAGNAQTAVASLLSEPNKNLIKQGVETPIAAFNLTGIEVGEVIVVVPKTGFVITEEASI